MSIYIEKNIGDTRFKVIMRDYTFDRLRNTCFRGPAIVRAGNFSAWYGAKEFLRDERVQSAIISEMRELSKPGISETHSVEIEFDQSIGWSSTDDLSKFPMEHLLPFALNRKAYGLKVKPEHAQYLAPKTNVVTIIFELKDEGDSYTAVVHSTYPGKDVGELSDNVSARENVVFFDWSHPGEH